ncbi:MAG: hypothetical protein AVDCRST_MAG25-3426, partial [uncultured Rubrobacteraceae bacterium]
CRAIAGTPRPSLLAEKFCKVWNVARRSRGFSGERWSKPSTRQPC